VPAEVLDGLRRGLLRVIDIELSRLPKSLLFNAHRQPASEPSGCYEASFGWVHVRPGCRCAG
jgi:hypothetical protein